MSDLISREYMKSLGATCIASRSKDGTLFPIVAIDELPPADPTHETPSNTLGALDCVERQFEEIVVEYPNITDEEHKGKPYYSIKYIENGEDKIIGFGTYKIEVLSRYIRDYFIQSAQHDVPDTNVGKWVSCSERLPKYEMDVLLQFTNNMCVGYFHPSYSWAIWSGGNWWTGILEGDEEPIAWMPLPEPWKGEQNDH